MYISNLAYLTFFSYSINSIFKKGEELFLIKPHLCKNIENEIASNILCWIGKFSFEKKKKRFLNMDQSRFVISKDDWSVMIRNNFCKVEIVTYNLSD